MSKMGIASSGSLARVFQRLHCTSSDRPLRHVRSSAAASRFVERGGGDFFGGGRSKSAGTRKRARRHHRHAEPLFATHYFTDAAWRAEQRDEVSSREAVLIHKVTDQIGDTRRPTGPFHFLVRGNQARLRSLSIRTRVASIARSPHLSFRTRHGCRRIGLPTRLADTVRSQSICNRCP
jgi:hypothetical protein